MKLIQNTNIQIKALVREAPSGQVGKAVLGAGFAALASSSWGRTSCAVAGAHWDSLLQMDVGI